MKDSRQVYFPQAIGQALRISQWVKNLLIFVPLAVSHNISNPRLIGQSVLAFAAFSLSASAGYIVNDLFDIEADRRHPRKKLRPFAAGHLSPRTGIILAGVLIIIAFSTAGIFLPPRFALLLLFYLSVSIAYSLRLKQIATVDILTLAGLYALRVLAGGIAVDIVPSTWLLAFSIFLFLSLAVIKRYAELTTSQQNGHSTAGNRRGYVIGDLDILRNIGTTSGYLSVLVLALYINSPEVRLLYKRPEALWLVTMLLLYWITRLWILTHRGRVLDDPLVFTFRDLRSYLVGGLMCVVILVASL